MRTDLISATSYRQAKKYYPWAAVIASNGTRNEYRIFEARKDYLIWKAKRKKTKLLMKGE